MYEMEMDDERPNHTSVNTQRRYVQIHVRVSINYYSLIVLLVQKYFMNDIFNITRYHILYTSNMYECVSECVDHVHKQFSLLRSFIYLHIYYILMKMKYVHASLYDVVYSKERFIQSVIQYNLVA